MRNQIMIKGINKIHRILNFIKYSMDFLDLKENTLLTNLIIYNMK